MATELFQLLSGIRTDLVLYGMLGLAAVCLWITIRQLYLGWVQYQVARRWMQASEMQIYSRKDNQ